MTQLIRMVIRGWNKAAGRAVLIFTEGNHEPATAGTSLDLNEATSRAPGMRPATGGTSFSAAVIRHMSFSRGCTPWASSGWSNSRPSFNRRIARQSSQIVAFSLAVASVMSGCLVAYGFQMWSAQRSGSFSQSRFHCPAWPP